MSSVATAPPATTDETAPQTAGLLLGLRAIGEFVEMRDDQVGRLVRRGEIPTFKVGGRPAATKESLRAWLADNAARARAEHEARRSAPAEATP